MINTLALTDYTLAEVCNSDLGGSKSLLIEGIGNCMSYMVGALNRNGCVIATDSLLTIHLPNYTYTVSDFKKVFYNSKNQLFWGVVGQYGQNEELLHLMNETIKEKDYPALQKTVKEYFQSHPTLHSVINIFICEFNDTPVLHILDFVNGEFQENVYQSCSAFYAGSNHNMDNSLGLLSQINQMSLDELVQKSKDTIQKAEQIEHYIQSQNSYYPISIGGDTIYAYMGNDGVIHSNGIEL